MSVHHLFEKVIVLYFFAGWHEESCSLLENIKAFAEFHPDVVFCKIEADEQPEVAALYEVETVPSLLFIKANNDIIKKVT